MSWLTYAHSLHHQVFPVSGGTSDARWSRSKRTWGGCILWTLSMCRRSSVPSACSDKPKQETTLSKDGPDGPENSPWKNQSQLTEERTIGLTLWVWACWLVEEVMAGLWGCQSWRGATTCQEGRAWGLAWPLSLWSSQTTTPFRQLLKQLCIKRDLCLLRPKLGNAGAEATAGTSYGLPLVYRCAWGSDLATVLESLLF